jgi:hypothetical protein
MAPLITSIEVSGDHFEIGCALGRPAAAAFRDRVRPLERFRALRSDWGGSDRLREIEQASRAAFPRYMREVDGIAEGLAAPFDDVFLWTCRGDFPGGGDQAGPGEAGCTSIMIAGDGSAPHIVAHNEDDEAGLEDACFWATVHPREGLAFSSFYSPGVVPGHTFGFNHAGLVQTINHIRPHDQRAGIARSIVGRAVLGCATLDEALAILRRGDRASGFHHNLGQTGDARLLSVETPASGCAVKEVAGASAHANHLVRPEFSEIAQEINGSSAGRQARADALIRSGGRDPLAILSDDDGSGLPIRRKLKGGHDSGFTLAAAVFEIGAQELDWRVHADPRDAPEHAGSLSVADPRDLRSASI